MSSYYREHVAYPNVSAGPYPPHLVTALDNGANNIINTHHDDPKRCSVKGCSAPLPPDCPHKMCEECRGRHRVYAMTKRAKRKMEKALLNGSAQNGQPVAWMPTDDTTQAEQEHPGQSPEPVAGPSRQFEVPVDESHEPEYDFSQQWDANSIDPRLFSQIQSHTSELAGALILPPPPHHPANHEVYSRNSHPPQQQLRPHSAASPPSPQSPPPAPEIHPVLAEVLKTVPGLNLRTRVTSGPTVPPGPSDGPLPPRFCSIKGCKTLIAGNSFFKMCEPCRDRYRSYGTTKRAKWKREKEVVVAELHQLRDKEDARCASEGLSPLSPPHNEQWQEYHPGEGEPTNPASGHQTPSGTPGPADAGEEGSNSTTSMPPRMCTVSHCREILAGGYQFLRCERHRIQNRHHSKLKRVRDKEVKAQVYDGWAAAIAPRADGESPVDGNTALPVDADATAARELAFAFRELDDQPHDGPGPLGIGSEFISEAAAVDFIHETGTGISATLAMMVDQQPTADTPVGEPTTGVPPAARGMRRTNHVCSIKACSNLLSPSNPWKMCDLCRSRDRAGRRIKALRDSGLILPEEAAAKIVEVRMEVEGKERRERKDKGTKKNKGKRKSTDGEGVVREGSDAGSGSAPQQPSHGEGSGAAAEEGVSGAQGGDDSQTSVFSSVPVPNHSNLVFMQPLLGQFASHLQHLAQASSSSVANATGASQGSGGEGAPSSTNGANARDAPPVTPKKRGKGKGKAKATQEESTSQSTDAPTSPSQAPPPHYPPPNGHPYPYYMPPFMPPYGAPPGFTYGYPAPPLSPSKGAAYSPPVYQPPPYGAYPYPYPYPGHPYPYAAQTYPQPPGQSYSAPPAGQSYTPPPPYPPSPSGEPSQTQQSSYPPPVPLYPYAHPYPVPPPPPPHQPSTTENPQQQSRQPSPSAPEDPPVSAQSSASTKRSRSSKTSTKSNSAKGNAAKDTSPNKPTTGAEGPAQKGPRFIVRTSETYESPATNRTRPLFSLKRPRDEDGGGDMSPNKRAEPETPGTYSQFRLNGTPIPTPPPPIPGTGVLNPSDFAPAPTPFVEENVTPVPTAVVAENGVSEKQAQCGNKTCKRILPSPSGTAGSLCERCRERLKKKQAKAKQRFKLEPKALVRRDLSAAVSTA
ncbi:hypothetical protein LXA43DRAFT_933980 [Ganoderma leucocontextum]|nr:hypothetical protein LXA43DRAFT_933980 [Ganoderma leucocontextum]